MKLTRQFHFNPALFSIVPLLNVLFLVLIFYALATRFVLQPGLPIALPASSFTVTPQEDAQIVSVTSAPAPGVYFHNEPVTIDEFSRRLTNSGARSRSLIIKADRNAPFDTIMQLMNRALVQGFSVVLATTPEQP